MGYQQGLSGLAGASSDLNTIGNNIANAHTVGFKHGQAQFTDVYANSVVTAINNRVGIGTRMSHVEQNFSQGTLRSDDVALHVAINGDGFFQMSNNGTLTYSRNGVFQLDKNGYITNADGLKLTGYPANVSGVINTATTVPLKVQTANIPPTATTTLTAGLNLNAQDSLKLGAPTVATSGALSSRGVTITDATQGTNADTWTIRFTGPGTFNLSSSGGFSQTGLTYTANTPLKLGNGQTITLTGVAAAGDTVTVAPNPVVFNPADSTTYSYATSVGVYDSLGGSHQVDMYFVKKSAGTWDVYAGKTGNVPTAKIGTAKFDTGGNLVSTTDAAGAATPTPFAFNFSIPNTDGSATPQALTLKIGGTTQFGSKNGTNSLTQDGFAAGQLSRFTIGTDGTLTGNYSNGQTAALGQITLATFANQNGLVNLGNNQYQATAASGVAVIGVPGSTNHGMLQGGATENSNVDLTSELVKLITAQRNYQANAQTIKTQRAVDQTLMNL